MILNEFFNSNQTESTQAGGQEQLQAELDQLQRQFDPHYQYSDDYTFWSKQNRIAQRMSVLKKLLAKGQQDVTEGMDDDDEPPYHARILDRNTKKVIADDGPYEWEDGAVDRAEAYLAWAKTKGMDIVAQVYQPAHGKNYVTWQVPDGNYDIKEQGVAEGLSEMDNRTPSGDREEQRRNRPEAKAKQDKEQQNRLKDTSPEMRKKLRLPEPKEGVAEGLGKNIKRLATGKDVKSRAGQEIAKSQDASMKGDNKTSKKHFDRFDKLDKLANKEQGVAEAGYPEVDHMPGPTIKRTQTGCKRCHGKGYVYKTPDGEVHPTNQIGAKKYKCGKCDGIGFVKVAEQGVAEAKTQKKEVVGFTSESEFKTWEQYAQKEGYEIREAGNLPGSYAAFDDNDKRVGYFYNKFDLPNGYYYVGELITSVEQGVAEGAPIVVMPRADRLKKAEPTKVRYQGDIVPPTQPPSTEKRGVKGRPGQRPMPDQGVVEGKDDKIAQLKKDYATAVHWSKNDTNPHKREAARQKAEKIKSHLEKQYKQGVAEDADQVKKVFKDKSGKPVGEIGIDPESSPGNGEWYVKHYASGYDVVGFDNAEEALEELKHCMKQGVAEGTTNNKLMLTETLTYKLWKTAGHKLMEAQLTADQINQIFQQVEQGANAAGGNRTMIGQGKDAAEAVNKAWETLKTKVQNSGPIQNIDQKYDQAAEQLKQATGGDQGVMQYVQKYRDFAKKHPIAQSLIYATLIAAAGISGAGVGGAAALGLFKMVDKLLQGEKFSSAAYQGAKTGGMAYAAGQIGQAMKGGEAPPNTGTSTATTTGSGITGDMSYDQAYNTYIQKFAQDPNNPSAMIVQQAKQFAATKAKDVLGSGAEVAGNTATNVTTSAANASGNIPYDQAFKQGLAKFATNPGNPSANDVMRAKDYAGKVASGMLKPVKESVELTEGQIYLMIGKIVERQRKLDEGIMDTIKGAAGKAMNWAQTKGTNLTTKITADKLLQAWKKAGSPTDSLDIASIVQRAGVPTSTIKQVFTSMKIPVPGQPAMAATPVAKPAMAATPVAKPAMAATPVAKPAAAAPTIKPASFNATNLMKMPGMEKYATPATKIANFAGPTGYGKTTTSIKKPVAAPAMAEAKPEDSKIGGRYTPTEFDSKLARIKANHQANPANHADLAARLQAAYKKQTPVAESRQQRKSLLKQILKG